MASVDFYQRGDAGRMFVRGWIGLQLAAFVFGVGKVRKRRHANDGTQRAYRHELETRPQRGCLDGVNAKKRGDRFWFSPACA